MLHGRVRHANEDRGRHGNEGFHFAQGDSKGSTSRQIFSSPWMAALSVPCSRRGGRRVRCAAR